MKNKRQINWLIKKYETITLEQMEKAEKIAKGFPLCVGTGDRIMRHLTGFSSAWECKPCSAVNQHCTVCGLNINSKRCYQQRTYITIEKAKTVKATFKAVRARAIFLKKHLEISK